MPPNPEADPVSFVAFASRRYRLAIDLDVRSACLVLERPSGQTISVHAQGGSEEARIRAGLDDLAQAGGGTSSSLLARTGSVMLSSAEVGRLLQDEPDTLTGLITDPEHLHRLTQEGWIDPWTVPIWLPDPLAGWAARSGVGGGRPGSASMEAEQAQEAARQLLAYGCDSVAVVLPSSSIDADGELWLEDVLVRMNDRVSVSLSHRAASFRAGMPRVLATLIDARVGARVREHLQRIRQVLESLGFSGDILIAQSSGGLASIDRVIRAPVSTADSVTATQLVQSSRLACRLGQRRFVFLHANGVSVVGWLVEVGAQAGQADSVEKDSDMMPVAGRCTGGRWVGPRVESLLPGTGSRSEIGFGGDLLLPTETVGSPPASEVIDRLHERIASLCQRRGMEPGSLAVIACGEEAAAVGRAVVDRISSSRLIVPPSPEEFSAAGLLRSSLCACHATPISYGDNGIHLGILDRAVTTLATRAVSDLAVDGAAREDALVVMEFFGPGADSLQRIHEIAWQPPSRRLSALDDFVAAVHQASGRAPGRPAGLPGFAGKLRVWARAPWGSEEEIDPGNPASDCY